MVAEARMDDREEHPRRSILPVDLDAMSIEALTDYRQSLHREIARVEAAIAGKQQARRGAEAVFRGKRES
jgi:uncharacterized small protein (DUF1192 family)